MHKDFIFREYDIRGVVGVDFDTEFANLLGRSLARYIQKKSNRSAAEQLIVTLGYDARLSSVELTQAACDGLKSSGVRVINLGLVTTPISYFSMFEYPGADGGIMITGSHNPPEYNGFKISAGKTTLYGPEIQELRTILAAKDFISGRGSEETFDIFPKYIARYREEFKNLKPIKVVVDCGNGAAGCILREMYTAAGLDPVILFEEPDGLFPNHHPDPTVEENLVALKAKVKEVGAAVGIGFDGDADRIGVVDSDGKMLMGDELMVLISRDILKTSPGAKIVGDVKCSDRMYDDIRAHGGDAIMWKTGHSLIKSKVKLEKAPFGGELSGHVFFSDRNYGYDDALYAGLRVIEILSRTGQTIPQLMAGMPHSWSTPEIRIDTTEEKKSKIVDLLKQKYSAKSDRYRTNLIDGIRISFEDGWALARASNTQPVLVLRFESNSEAGLQRIQSEIESQVHPLL
jgi:phosphomannomutase / phosphoglucomutase